jgi:hypothetical protein
MTKSIIEQVNARILPVADTRFLEETRVVSKNICQLLAERLEGLDKSWDVEIRQLVKELRGENEQK